MKQLLSIEYSKLKRLNAIKIILVIYMVMVPLFMYVASEFLYGILFPGLKIQQSSLNPGAIWKYPQIWDFPEILKYTFYCASYFHVLVSLILVIIVSNEFSYRTAKQNIIDGLNKRQLITSKLLILLFLALFVTVYNSLLALILGIFNSDTVSLYENSHYIFVFFFQSFCYFTIALFFVTLIRHTAMSIVAVIVFPIVDFIAGKLIPPVIYVFFPLNIFSTLTPSPVRKEIISLEKMQTKTEVLDLPLWQLSLLATGFVVLFYLFSYFSLKRRDM